MGWKTGVLIVIALAAAFAWVAGASMIARTLSDIADTPWVVAAYLGSLLVLVAILYVIYRKRFRPKQKRRTPPVARTKRPVDEVLTDIDRRLTDPAEMDVVAPEQGAATTVSLCGAPGVGTSGLAALLREALDPDLIAEAGSLSTDAEDNRRTLALARRSSLPVLVVDNDLRSHEFEAATELATHNPRTIIVLNKADTFAPEDKARLLEVITGRVEGLIAADRVVSVSADPRPIRRVQADGAEREIAQEPDIQALVELISAALKA